MIRIMTLGLLLLTGVALTACGQKGPLYLPSDAPTPPDEISSPAVQEDLKDDVKARIEASSKAAEDSSTAETESVDK